MDIASYRRSVGVTQSEFASAMTDAGSPATQSLISQWESGAVRPPPERWEAVAAVTGGKVSPRDLRPDIFGPAAGGQITHHDFRHDAPGPTTKLRPA